MADKEPYHDEKRSDHSILFSYLMLLLRSMNEQLLEDDGYDPSEIEFRVEPEHYLNNLANILLKPVIVKKF